MSLRRTNFKILTKVNRIFAPHDANLQHAVAIQFRSVPETSVCGEQDCFFQALDIYDRNLTGD
jgi:hypothetical protein